MEKGKRKLWTRYSVQQSSSMGDVLVIDKVEADRRTRGLSRLATVVSRGQQDSDGFRHLKAGGNFTSSHILTTDRSVYAFTV